MTTRLLLAGLLALGCGEADGAEQAADRCSVHPLAVIHAVSCTNTDVCLVCTGNACKTMRLSDCLPPHVGGSDTERTKVE